MLVVLSGASACEDSVCRELRGAKYRTVEPIAGRGCEDRSVCGHHSSFEFHADGTYYLDLDDTDSSGSYTCADGKLELGGDMFSAELSGERLLLRGPGGTPGA